MQVCDDRCGLNSEDQTLIKCNAQVNSTMTLEAI